MRREFVPTDAETARAIAIHTEAILKQIRASDQISQLDEIYRGYQSYAAKMHVCHQIMDHVQMAFNETVTVIKAKAKNARVLRDPTGEANHAD